MTQPETLPPSGIGKSAKYNFSPWFIKLRFQNKEPLNKRYWKRATKGLSPIQSKIGNEFEKKVYEELEPKTKDHISEWYEFGDEKNEEKLVNKIKEVENSSIERPVMMTQVRLDGSIGCFEIVGDADLMILFPTDYGIQINVIDIKSSWEEKPSQQLQTATYTTLIRDILDNYNINYELKGGIVYRETDINGLISPDEVPTFNTESREGDVKRVLSEDGPFVRAFNTDYEDLPLVVNYNSPFAEVTAVEAVENGDISILGLTPSEKKKFSDYDINNIEDLASLYEIAEDPKPYNYDEKEVLDDKKEIVRSLEQDPSISSNISNLCHRAQSILGEFNPDHPHSNDQSWIPWIEGTGNGELPEDDPPYEADLPIRRNSMIRVYMDIQYDHVRDEVIAISGVVTSGLYDGQPLEFSSVCDEIQRETDTWGSNNEKELIKESISKLYETIKFISDFASHGTNTPIHFYFYNNSDVENLYDSIIRHEDDSNTIASFRKFLDAREGIDQKMVSTIQDEIENRMGIKDMDKSLPAIVDKTYPNEDNATLSDSDWKYRDGNGNEIDLKNAYKNGIFDTSVPIKYGDDGSYSVLTKKNDDRSYDSFYKIVPQDGSDIPIEYLWGSEDVDILDKSWSEKSRQENIIDSYRWVDKDKKNTRMTASMFESLSRTFSKGILHIERSLVYRNTDINKSEIDLKKLENTQSDEKTLLEACFEYLDLESYQTKSDAIDIYSKPLIKRITDGDSIPMMVTNVEEDLGYMFKVSGKLLLEDLNIKNPVEIAGSSKISGSDEGATGGSRCVATPLISTSDGYEVAINSPEKISSSTKITVESYDPDAQKIKIKGYRQSRKSENRYTKSRIPWTLDSNKKGKKYVGPGQAFILDPSPDNKMADKSIKALENEENVVYKDIKNSRTHEKEIDESIFRRKECAEYIDYVRDALDFVPNKKQQKYIKTVKQYSLLQGPPGTGKTSGAISHAILSRTYDMEKRDNSLSGLITGLSNKSVDEVMKSISEIKDMLDSEFEDHLLENIRMVRLSYGEPNNPLDNVEYLNYQEENDLELLRRLVSSNKNSKQTTLESTGGPREHVLVFSTPGRIDGLMDNIYEDKTAEDVYDNPVPFFDLITIDEASMMPTYQLFMVSGFMSGNGQLLIGGDHRQLPPVQKYDWSDEKRKSIQHHVPHLSVLDYFRYIRGEEVDRIYEETEDSPKIEIPMIRLEKTYRCHRVMTDFLRKSVYEKDQISYYSDKNELISIENNNEIIDKILNPSYPITLIIHDETSSQQYNPVEENIISNLLDEIPTRYSTGIVTPHNSQKGKLRVSCQDSDVDTVERFQGGEKDIMFVSTTVSDPDHLSKEEDFILSENRLNVALSRMKKKLVIVASKSVFNIVPNEIETYNEAIIWKSMYQIASRDGTPSYSNNISEILGSKDYNIDVYNIKDIP